MLRSGITDVTIYEKADEVGGTWRENTYPGLTCDVPSRVYRYTFATKPNWTRMFSPGGEIQAYFRGIADRFALRGRIRFGTEIVSARFEDGRWVLRTDAGDESTVDFLISATGVLHHPRMPSIAGLDDFGGRVFHSARWDHSVEIQRDDVELRAAMPDTVWTTGCNSWYLNKDGVPEVWPCTPAEHRAMLANPDLGQYDFCRSLTEA